MRNGLSHTAVDAIYTTRRQLERLAWQSEWVGKALADVRHPEQARELADELMETLEEACRLVESIRSAVHHATEELRRSA